MRRTSALVAGFLTATVLATAGALPAAGAGPAEPEEACPRGEFCAWARPDHTGRRLTWDLARAGVESCVPLPAGFTGRSFANRLTRPVTVYEDAECATEGEFNTYPGDGTWVPDAPFAVQAFQVWES